MCPDAKLIQQYLADKTGFDETIPDDARVCTSCYKASIEEIITDALPEDLDEIMEWVFREYEAEAECEEGSDNE